MKTIKEDIKNRKFKRVYLLYGTEEYLKRLYKNKLKEAVLQDSDAMNMAEYAGKGIDEKEVREFADTLPFFADYHLLILENTGWFKTSTDFADYVPELPDTAVLVFVKTDAGGTEDVWFYDMKADGFSLDDKRSPVSENDIPDIIARFRDPEGEKGRERTEQSFFVPKSEIVENGYDLSINKYKKTEYVAVEYPPTSEILAEIRELQKQIDAGLCDLEGMLDV